MSLASSFGSLAWVASLGDAGVKTDVQAAVTDGSFGLADLVKILDDVAAAGAVTSAEFSALQTVAAHLDDGASTADSLAAVFRSLVDGSVLNATWTGGGTTATALGNLHAGATVDQLDKLIAKWFLGTDNPDATDGGMTPAYKLFSAPLFSSAGPSTSDVVQGNVGDCEVLTGLNEIVTNDPAAIRSMIVDQGNGAYSVRFFLNGDATWVTVDAQFPIYSWGGLLYQGNGAQSPANLWVNVVEKAFAVFSSELPGYGAANRYFNINGNAAVTILEALTPADSVDYYSYADANWSAEKALIVAAVESGDDVTLESEGNTANASGQTLLVASHAFAVVGYDAATGDFIVRNPWGPSSSVVAQFEVSMADVAGVYGDFAVSNSGFYSSPVRVYGAPRELLAGTPVAVASLFSTADNSGAAITRYRFETTGSGTLALNGAVNLANAAETALGQIVLSAADLSKLTFSATSGAPRLLAWAFDGARWSADASLSLAVASGASAIVPLAAATLAPGSTVALSSLFKLTGAAGSSPTYQIDLNGSNLTLNLNGASNWGSGASQFDFSASDLSKITLTAGAGPGAASFSVIYYNGSSWSDWQTVPLTIAAGVRSAIDAFNAGLYSQIGSVADSAAAIFANLDSLQAIFASGRMRAIAATDAAPVAETLTATRFYADLGALTALSGKIDLTATGLSVAQLASLKAPLATPYHVTIVDNAPRVALALDALAVDARVAAITLLGGLAPVMTLSAAQVATDGAALGRIVNRLWGETVVGATTYFAGGNGLAGADILLSASSVAVKVKDNSHIDVTGSGVVATLGASVSFGLVGAGGVIVAGAGDRLRLNGTGLSVTASGDAIALTAGASATITGAGDTIGATLGGDTLTLGGNGATGAYHILHAAGDSIAVEADGRVSLVGSNNAATLAGGATLIVNGSNDAIAAGAGARIAIVAGTADSLTASGVALRLASGVSTSLSGAGNAIAATLGGATLSLFGPGTGTADAISVGGSGDRLQFNAGAFANVADRGAGLALAIADSSAKVVVSNFAADASGWIDLLNGSGGYSSVSDVLSALTPDGHGGTKLSLGAGYIDFAGLSASAVASHNFVFG